MERDITPFLQRGDTQVGQRRRAAPDARLGEQREGVHGSPSTV